MRISKGEVSPTCTPPPQVLPAAGAAATATGGLSPTQILYKKIISITNCTPPTRSPTDSPARVVPAALGAHAHRLLRVGSSLLNAQLAAASASGKPR
jgi:hypothetical protein